MTAPWRIAAFVFVVCAVGGGIAARPHEGASCKVQIAEWTLQPHRKFALVEGIRTGYTDGRGICVISTSGTAL